MSDKLHKTLSVIDNVFHNLKPERRIKAYSHSSSVAQNCVLLAVKRNLDIEIAWIIGYLHDIYAFSTDIQENHALSGAAQLRPILRNMGVFNDEEMQTIIKAILFHSKKDTIQGEYEELLKDGDTLNHFTFNLCNKVKVAEKERLERLSKEIGFDIKSVKYIDDEKPTTLDKELFVENAKRLSVKNIVGDRNDVDFMNIIKYCPEEYAFDELKNGWCAAFVYHCLFISGLKLPLMMPESKNRIVGVKPFKEWAVKNSIYINFENNRIPKVGDIIVYDNIITIENKEEYGCNTDHIGIVIEIENDILITAEGNANNENISGIVNRERNKNIDGYIRVPKNYTYSLIDDKSEIILDYVYKEKYKLNGF